MMLIRMPELKNARILAIVTGRGVTNISYIILLGAQNDSPKAPHLEHLEHVSKSQVETPGMEKGRSKKEPFKL